MLSGLTTLLDQLSKFLSSRYLISAFLPWAAFCAAHALTAGFLVGLAPALAWLLDLPGAMLSLLSLIGVLILVLGTFVVIALNRLFQGILAGEAGGWLLSPLFDMLGERKWRLYEVTRKKEEEALKRWRDDENLFTRQLKTELTDAFKASVARALPRVPPAELERFSARLDALSRSRIDRAVLLQLKQDLFAAYGTYSATDFADLQRTLLRKARDFVSLQAQKYEDLFLHRQSYLLFPARLRPTDFGNALATLEGYAESRYEMKWVLFWTRLQYFIKEEFRALLKHARTQVDLFAALTLFTLLYAFPWAFVFLLLSEYWTALGFLVGGGLLVALFHRASFEAALSFAELGQTAIDLFRRDLLKGLNVEPADSLDKEREQWEQLTRQLHFGERKREAQPAPGPPSGERYYG